MARSTRTPSRASVVGGGSFGTAVALLLERAGVRTTLLCRTEEQARTLIEARENQRYLPGRRAAVESEDPRASAPATTSSAGPTSSSSRFRRRGSARPSRRSSGSGCRRRPAWCRSRRGSCRRTGCRRRPRSSAPSALSGRPASAVRRTRARWSRPAPAWSARSHSEELALRVSELFQRAGVVCEASNDPVGVELRRSGEERCRRSRRRDPVAGPQRGRHGSRRHLPRGAVACRAVGRLGAHVRRSRRHRRSRRDGARADLAQPQRRRAAGRRDAGRRDPGAARPGGRGARDRAPAGARDRARRARGSGRPRRSRG